MRLGSLGVALLVVAATAGSAAARSEKTLAYPRDQAWSAAVRFLVVDERVKITDKDETAGYVVFELKDDGKLFRGSLELIVVDEDHRKAVKFVTTLEDRPSWLEVKMLERLALKLRTELGSPAPPASPRAPQDPPKDAPKDGDKKDPPAKPKEPGDINDDGPPISTTP
jgi:hypothetical protein|nr:hypothetical protein [Kofleriaceae bacterium]